MFHHVAVALHHRRVIGKFYSEPQRSIVEDFVVLVTVWHDDTAVFHQRRCTAAERRTHFIAVESITMVEVVGGLDLHLFCLGIFASFLQVSNTLVVGEFHLIAFLHLQVRSILHPHIDAIGFLARPLQCRTIEAVCRAVVLPGDVVHTLGILSACDIYFWFLGCPQRDGIDGFATRSYGSIDEQQAIIGNLIIHFLTHGIFHHESLALVDAKAFIYILHIHFNDFLSLCAL